MRLPVNLEIALTHIVTRKKQTLVTALGITIGVSIYLFMNSLSSGFSDFSRDSIFQSSAHIRINKEDEMSQPQEHPDLSFIEGVQLLLKLWGVPTEQAVLRYVVIPSKF